MSQQTLASIEQSERRVESAERVSASRSLNLTAKEVLVLRDREAALRRRLMEHWAGVMAWEVRRLEACASETSARHAVHSHAYEEAQDREYELTQRIRNLEEQLAAGGSGHSREDVGELQMREQDLTHRLRAAEAELEHYTNQARGFDSERSQSSDKLRRLEVERDEHAQRVRDLETERDQHAERARSLETDLGDHVEQIRRLEAERDEQAQRARQLEAERDLHAQQTRHLETELDTHVQRSRQLEAERDTHATRIRALDTQRGTENSQLGALQTEMARHLTALRTVESERDGLSQRSRDLETERDGHSGRIAELEEMVTEYERREKVLQSDMEALQENARSFDGAVARFTEDRDNWLRERDQMMQDRIKERDELNGQLDELEAERDSLLKQRDAFNRERDDLHHQHTKLIAETSTHVRALERYKTDREAWDVERQQLVAEGDTQRGEHEVETRLLAENEQAVSLSRSALARIGVDLGALLGRSPVPESEMGAAIDELAAMLGKRDREITSLQGELREANQASVGLNSELQRVQIDRDAWKRKPESERSTSTTSNRAAQGETMELVRKIRLQNDEIAALKTRLEVAELREGGPGGSSPELENKVATLEAELTAINTALSKAWGVLPAPGACGEAGLSGPRVVSPNSVVNFVALQRAYAGPPANDNYPGIDGLLARVTSVVADGRIMVERMARMDKEKERHKANAAKAAKLVEDSRHSLETYHRQVSDLQERLARGSASV